MNQIAMNAKGPRAEQMEPVPFGLLSSGMQGVIPKLISSNQAQINSVFHKNDQLSKNRLRNMYEQLVQEQFGNNVPHMDREQAYQQLAAVQHQIFPAQQKATRRFQNDHSTMQYPQNQQRVGHSTNKSKGPQLHQSYHNGQFVNYEQMNAVNKGLPLNDRKILGSNAVAQ